MKTAGALGTPAPTPKPKGGTLPKKAAGSWHDRVIAMLAASSDDDDGDGDEHHRHLRRHDCR